MIWRIVTPALALLLGGLLIAKLELAEQLGVLDSFEASRSGQCVDDANRADCQISIAVMFGDAELCKGDTECLSSLAVTEHQPAHCLSAKKQSDCFFQVAKRLGVEAQCKGLSGLALAKCEDGIRLVRREEEEKASVGHCDKLSADEKFQCKADAAVDNLLPSQCEKLPFEYRDPCLAQITPHQTPDLAFVTCARIADPEQLISCQMLVSQRAPGLCGQIPGHVRECLDQVEYLPMRSCGRLPREFTDDCIALAAFRARRPDFCARMKDRHRTEACAATAYRSRESCKYLSPLMQPICEEQEEASPLLMP